MDNQGFQMGVEVEILLVPKHQSLRLLELKDETGFASRFVGKYNELTRAGMPAMDDLRPVESFISNMEDHQQPPNLKRWNLTSDCSLRRTRRAKTRVRAWRPPAYAVM